MLRYTAHSNVFVFCSGRMTSFAQPSRDAGSRPERAKNDHKAQAEMAVALAGA